MKRKPIARDSALSQDDSLRRVIAAAGVAGQGCLRAQALAMEYQLADEAPSLSGICEVCRAPTNPAVDFVEVTCRQFR
jgi:hypothetical protein